MLSKLQTVAWFAARPTFWPHMLDLVHRRLFPAGDSTDDRVQATRWAAGQAQSIEAALGTAGIYGSSLPRIPDDLLAEGRRLSEGSTVTMGGAGDLNLLYAAARLIDANKVVETGVAYGWSSLALLAALEDRPHGRLVSVDMPYPKLKNEAFVGVAVPARLRNKWTLVREPDRYGLPKALALIGGAIDLCHYDSDKSYSGRKYAYPILWGALRPGGLLISDDIQDNFRFRDFAEEVGRPFGVVESGGKFIGLIRKP